MSCFSACSTIIEYALASLSISPSEMIPPRVAQRIGHVGLSAMYSPGQAKLYTDTAPTPRRLAISIERITARMSARNSSQLGISSIDADVRSKNLNGDPALIFMCSSPRSATAAPISSTSASDRSAIAGRLGSWVNHTYSTPISFAASSPSSRGSCNSFMNIAILNGCADIDGAPTLSSFRVASSVPHPPSGDDDPPP